MGLQAVPAGHRRPTTRALSGFQVLDGALQPRNHPGPRTPSQCPHAPNVAPALSIQYNLMLPCCRELYRSMSRAIPRLLCQFVLQMLPTGALTQAFQHSVPGLHHRPQWRGRRRHARRTRARESAPFVSLLIILWVRAPEGHRKI